MINDCIDLAAIAQQYYLKPISYGGGGQSFTNWEIPSSMKSTAVGSYKITNIKTNEIIIMATGTEVVTGSDSVKVQVTIPAPPEDYQIQIIN